MHPYHPMIQHQQKHIRYPVAHGGHLYLHICMYRHPQTSSAYQVFPDVPAANLVNDSRAHHNPSLTLPYNRAQPSPQITQITNKFKSHYHKIFNKTTNPFPSPIPTEFPDCSPAPPLRHLALRPVPWGLATR